MPHSSPPPRAPGTVVRIRDLAGRPRGTGFVVDAEGTVLTSHEAVDGLTRLVLYAPGDGHTWLIESPDVTSLPGADLAVVRARGLAGARPFALAAAVPDDGAEVAVALPRARVPGRVVAAATATYTATDRYHLVEGVRQLALAPHESLRVGGEASGAPVLDAASGAVVAVVGTALHADRGGVALAVPLRGAADDAAGTLGDALDRGGAQVAAYGRDLNLAGALELGAAGAGAVADGGAAGTGGAWAAGGGARGGTVAATGVGPEGGPVAFAAGAAGAGRLAAPVWGEPVERRAVAAEFGRFFGGAAHVLALVGHPGTGRSTELARLAARRAAGAAPAPSVCLRGADLKVADAGVRDAVARALRDAAGVVTAAAGAAGCAGDPATATPEAVAAQAHVAGRPLLVLLDCPEEMPPVLAQALGEWTAHTAEWLGEHGVRLVLACRPEYWERAGALFPAEMLHAGQACPETLPPCVPLGDFTPAEAGEARTRYGIPATALRPADARHPLTLRLLAEVRAALPRGAGSHGYGVAGPAQPGGAAAAAYRGAARGAGRGLGAPADHAVAQGGRGPAAPAAAAPPAAVRAPGVSAGTGSAAPLPGGAAAGGPSIGAGADSPGAGAGPVSPAPLPGEGAEGDGSGSGGAELPDAGVATVSAVPGARSPGTPAGAGPGSAAPGAGPGGGVGPPRRIAAVAVGPGPRRWEVFEAYLALVSLRVAERLAHGAGPAGPRGAAVGRLAAYVAGQVHEAARRCLGPGQGELERAAFEELFPWRVPDHLAGLTGWASAVLAEGLLVPAGAGYRFAHEEFADWLQGAHLDVDAALAVLVHRTSERWRPGDLPSSADGGAGRRALPVAPHRIGACVEALLLLERRHGRTELGHRLTDLLGAADAAVSRRSAFPEEPGAGTPPAADGGWWGAHLLGETLLRVPDARPYRHVLRRLATCLAGHAARFGGTAQLPGVLAPFGPAFFTRLPLPLADRLDLLRLLLPADTRRPSAYLTAAGELLQADPTAVQPLLVGWFDDDRALPHGGATVADAAQALLHTHRARAVDDLAEALVASAHPRAAELLAELAEDEPSGLCRAVDRWARDPRAERRVAAAAYAPATARHARGAADRALLRYAAQALLAHADDDALHGPALAVLLRDPHSRAGHLDRALALLAADDPHLAPADFAPALATHPGPVLDAFRDLLHRPGTGAADVLRTLARVRPCTPALARSAADLVREYVDHHPEGAAAAADFVDRRLEHGQSERAVLFPLAVELLTAHSPVVRRALAPVVAAPGTRTSRPLRRELLGVLLDREREPAVLDALLAAVGRTTAGRPECRTRDLVQGIGLLLSRTPEGAAVFDRRLVALAAELPAFADQLRGWLAADRDAWAVLLGPSAQLAVGTSHPRRAS
ncbi:serine protease [Streptomyces sp. WMMC500]|uniref:trypsin-like peptidase domain-containing protein n=1 Tax=Streptomyces sp. WMMC500 TaxID=3015154 RepID=UPI00248AE299|nr:trypsin-like peptidase domain-containing protein [Streptomyces sp. WMMC500]WBB62715.1 serine protease [Streptomyces sp. WMMC500]